MTEEAEVTGQAKSPKKKKEELQTLSKIKLKSIEKIDGISNKLNDLDGKFNNYKILEKEINKYRTEISFIDLYSAIVVLSDSQKLDKCPVQHPNSKILVVFGKFCEKFFR